MWGKCDPLSRWGKQVGKQTKRKHGPCGDSETENAAMSDLRPNVFALQLIDQKVAKWILNIVIVVIIVQHT